MARARAGTRAENIMHKWTAILPDFTPGYMRLAETIERVADYLPAGVVRGDFLNGIRELMAEQAEHEERVDDLEIDIEELKDELKDAQGELDEKAKELAKAEDENADLNTKTDMARHAIGQVRTILENPNDAKLEMAISVLDDALENL